MKKKKTNNLLHFFMGDIQNDIFKFATKKLDGSFSISEKRKVLKSIETMIERKLKKKKLKEFKLNDEQVQLLMEKGELVNVLFWVLLYQDKIIKGFKVDLESRDNIIHIVVKPKGYDNNEGK